MSSATASTATDRQYTASERATALASVLFARGFIESPLRSYWSWCDSVKRYLSTRLV
jgi:hypothetical protein